MAATTENAQSLLKSVAEVALGGSLATFNNARLDCISKGMVMEAGVFEEAMQRVGEQLSEFGLDPELVLLEQIRISQASTK